MMVAARAGKVGSAVLVVKRKIKWRISNDPAINPKRRRGSLFGQNSIIEVSTIRSAAKNKSSTPSGNLRKDCITGLPLGSANNAMFIAKFVENCA